MSDKSFTPAELNDGFVVAIEIDAKAGEEEAIAQALRALVEPTDRKAFYIFELYQNEAGWAEHQTTGHFKAFADKMLPRVARRERIPFVPF
jgi:quinol monooxygenase YgiN